MTRTSRLGAVLALLAIQAMPVWAHHSVAAEFDTANRGELKGEITRVWFTNPHVRYQLTVRNEDGSIESWELQGGNVTNLLRQGWREDSIRVGDSVTVSGALGRAGAKKLNIADIVTSAGVHLPQRTTAPARDRNVINASADKHYGYASGKNAYPVDITGPWRNDYKWHVTVDDLEPKPVPLTAAGRKL